MADIISLNNLGGSASPNVIKSLNPVGAQPQTEVDFLDKVSGVLKIVENILSKGDVLYSTLSRIGEKKGLFQERTVDGEPQKIEERIAYSPDVLPKRERPRLPVADGSTPIYNSPPQAQIKNDKMEIKEEIVEKTLDELIKLADEKTPKNYKKKSVEEIILEYKALEGFKKQIVMTVITKEIKKFLEKEVPNE